MNIAQNIRLLTLPPFSRITGPVASPHLLPLFPHSQSQYPCDAMPKDAAILLEHACLRLAQTQLHCLMSLGIEDTSNCGSRLHQRALRGHIAYLAFCLIIISASPPWTWYREIWNYQLPSETVMRAGGTNKRSWQTASSWAGLGSGTSWEKNSIENFEMRFQEQTNRLQGSTNLLGRTAFLTRLIKLFHAQEPGPFNSGRSRFSRPQRPKAAKTPSPF